MNSYGLWIATEINEHYDSEDSRTSFIKVAFARQIASKQIKILWDLNPCSPNHKIYKDYIDNYKDNGLLGGYNYEHFTINDNLAIDDIRRDEIKSMYNPNTVWYKRDILGLRCIAEGLIYQHFADNTSSYMITKEQAIKQNITHLKFGVDFGGNKSKNAFVCTGFTSGLRKMIVLRAETHEGYMTPDKLANLFVEFVEKCYTDYGKGGDTYCDSAEKILIAGIKSAIARERVPTNVHDARKNPINQRIKLAIKMMSQGRCEFVEEDCRPLIEALCQAVWDNKEGHEDDRLDNNSYCVDVLDAWEYSYEPHLEQLKNTN